MANHDTESARDFRRDWIRKARPAAAEEMLDEATFRRRYRMHNIVPRDRMADIEKSKQVMFCPACRQPYNPSLVKARRLHVVYEKDPLGNYALLATLTCMGCDWSEIIPIEAKGETPTEQQIQRAVEIIDKQDADRYGGMNAMMNSQHLGGAGGMGAASQMLSAQYSQEMLRRYMDSTVMESLANIRPPLIKYGQNIADSVWKEIDRETEMLLESSAQARRVRLKHPPPQYALPLTPDQMQTLQTNRTRYLNTIVEGLGLKGILKK